jgi:iron(III) transport system substrate-binding protein
MTPILEAERRGARRPLLLMVCAALACGLPGCRDRDRPSREVVLYCSVDQQTAEPIIAAFERSSGIRVLARFDTEAVKTVGLVQRLRAKADRPEADVFWSSEIFHTVRLAREGLLQPYRTPATEAWPKEFADPEGRWYGFGLRMRVVAYHTARVMEAEAPATLEDLLDPKWRGRLVMGAPEFGTTCGQVAAWFVFYGEQRATEILEGLKANAVRLVDGNSTAVRMVATGQADLCLTDTDDVYAARRNGWPVAMKFLSHGGAGVLAIPNTAAMIRGAPHPAEARALAEFLLSDQTERLLARSDSHNTPVRESVAREFPAYASPPRLPVDYDKVADCVPTAIDVVRKVLR